MNLRDIKKDIDYVLSAFIEDCTVCAAVNPKSVVIFNVTCGVSSMSLLFFDYGTKLIGLLGIT